MHADLPLVHEIKLLARPALTLARSFVYKLTKDSLGICLFFLYQIAKTKMDTFKLELKVFRPVLLALFGFHRLDILLF